jgi:hypothetical protein
MNQTTSNFMSGAELAWANFVTFLPKLGMFLLIIVAGYFIAKWIGKLVDAILERVGFDRTGRSAHSGSRAGWRGTGS